MRLGQPDVTLLLDNEGVIRDIKLSEENAEDRLGEMIGCAWIDTVADVGSEKIKAMVADARASRVSGLRQVTQKLPGGRELLLEYTTVCLAGSAGFVAVGRNLQTVADLQAKLIAAQQAMERDYWKLRQIESRYRILFDASTEAVLLVSAGDLRIVEANPAALRALNLGSHRGKSLIGRELLPEFGPEDRSPIQSALAQARELGRAPGILIHIGPERAPWTVRASLMASEPGPLYLLQFAPMGSSAPGDFDEGPALDELIERLPDAFVVLDRDGAVVQGNRSFLDLVQLGTRAQAAGAPLSRWLGRPGADMAVLMNTLLRHGVLRLFSTTIRGDLGLETEIEISAAVVTDEAPHFIGMLMRDVGRRLEPVSDFGGGIGAIRLPVAEQIGKSTLRQLVKQTVQVVERHYVEAALQMTGGNRSAAAEVLGLSRQNLYSKLDRYGLMGKADADQDEGEGR
jgi:transcriptional regulator PpsR